MLKMRKKKENYALLCDDGEALKKRILLELCKIAFADAGDFVCLTSDGKGGETVTADPKSLKKKDTSVLSEISKSSTGLKVKLYNKETALSRLGYYLGMWANEPESEEEDFDAIKATVEDN